MEKDNKLKTKYQPIYDVDSDSDYDVDAVLKKELEEQNLDYRWIDFKKAKTNGGRSRAGWIIYRRVSEDPRIQGIKVLEDPDGLVRNGSMVLAVKTKNNADKQRAKRDHLARTFNDYGKVFTDELTQKAKKVGPNTRIIQGYDKNS